MNEKRRGGASERDVAYTRLRNDKHLECRAQGLLSARGVEAYNNNKQTNNRCKRDYVNQSPAVKKRNTTPHKKRTLSATV